MPTINDGSTAYIAGGTGTTGHDLQIVSIASPQQMSVVGRINTSGVATEVIVDGTTAYLSAVFPSGLRSVSLANPNSPTLVGSYFPFA